MFGWVIVALLIIWGFVGITDSYKKEGAFGAFVGFLIWFIAAGGAIFVLIYLIFTVFN